MSAVLGAGLGGAYGLAAYLLNRLALRYERQRFLALAAGGMLLRMVGMLAAVGLTVALVDLRLAPFAAALVAMLLTSLAVEIFALYRWHASA